MKLLAVDTALDDCAVALLHGDPAAPTLTVVGEVIGRGHAEKLMAMIMAATAEAGVALAEIDAFAASIGPGSFTGIRVGVAAARGFALASGRPAVAVSSLEALAEEVRELAPARPVVAVLDARKDEVYAQGFAADGSPVAPPFVAAATLAAALAADLGAMVIGSGAPLLAAVDPSLTILAATPFPAIDTIARLALPRLAAAVPGRDLPAPLYVRPPDAKPQGAARLARLTPGGLVAGGGR